MVIFDTKALSDAFISRIEWIVKIHRTKVNKIHIAIQTKPYTFCHPTHTSLTLPKHVKFNSFSDQIQQKQANRYLQSDHSKRV